MNSFQTPDLMPLTVPRVYRPSGGLRLAYWLFGIFAIPAGLFVAWLIIEGGGPRDTFGKVLFFGASLLLAGAGAAKLIYALTHRLTLFPDRAESASFLRKKSIPYVAIAGRIMVSKKVARFSEGVPYVTLLSWTKGIKPMEFCLDFEQDSVIERWLYGIPNVTGESAEGILRHIQRDPEGGIAMKYVPIPLVLPSEQTAPPKGGEIPARRIDDTRPEN